MIRHPAEVIICVCAFMSYWAGLGSATFQQQVDAGGEDHALHCVQPAGETEEGLRTWEATGAARRQP
jgi:hypothetical protein